MGVSDALRVDTYRRSSGYLFGVGLFAGGGGLMSDKPCHQFVDGRVDQFDPEVHYIALQRVPVIGRHRKAEGGIWHRKVVDVKSGRRILEMH